jgi:hypothetical protein
MPRAWLFATAPAFALPPVVLAGVIAGSFSAPWRWSGTCWRSSSPLRS